MSPTFTDRLLSLDAFRGLTIAAMVLVNNPGTWSSIYWPLEHAEWNGWTPTDLVFPFFLFIVGVSITLAFARRVEQDAVQRVPHGAARRALFLKVIKRAAIIFALGFFLNLFPRFDFATVRIPGVLQRIAVCYLIASLIFLTTKARTQFAITLALLLVYWLLMTRVAAPGFAAGDLSKEGSLASYVDRLVFGAHVWRQAKVYDPEGILSRSRDDVVRRSNRSLAAQRANPLGQSGGNVCSGRGLRGSRLGVEPVLSDQQSAVDQLLRAVHRRTRIATARALLLAHRYSGLSPVGLAV